MKKSKKTISLILCLFMGLALLAACSGDSGSGSGTSPASSAPASSSPGGADASPGGGAAQTTTTPAMVAPAPEEEDVVFAEHIELIIDATAIAVLCPMNPAGTGMSTNWCYEMYFDTLVKLDEPTGAIMPHLATEWTTDDYQTYVFKLRDDVYFHNGDKFTAHDVVNSHRMATTGGGGFPSWDYWMRIETATALDDYTIEFVCRTVNVDFYYGLTIPYNAIVNEKAVEADPEKGWWVGTGAYKVADFSSREYVAFERNDDYWGPLPITKTQTWRFIPEMATRTIMLQNGEADICFELPETDVGMFIDDPNFEVFLSGGLNPNSLHLNQDDPLMADANFRQAVLYALDRDEVSILASGDLALFIEDGSVWGATTPHRNTDIPLIQQDLQKAQEFLDASSYNGEEVVLTTALGYHIRAAQAVQQQLSRIGINVSINQLDLPGFTAATVWTDNTTQMSIWTNLLGSSPFGYLNNFGAPSVHNRSKMQDPEMSELLAALPTMTNEADRDAAWKRAQEITFELNTCIPMYRRANAIVARKGAGGLVLPSNGLNDIRYLFIVEQ